MFYFLYFQALLLKNRILFEIQLWIEYYLGQSKASEEILDPDDIRDWRLKILFVAINNV